MQARNIPRMVGMAALPLLLLLLSGTATATSYPSADQYSLRNHYRITRRSAGHETLPTSVSTDYDEDEERQRQAVSLTELLELWEPERRQEERRPLQRGDIEVTTKGVERGDVPVIGKRRKLVRRQAPAEMWGFAEDDGMLTSDEEARPTSHPHRKHHRNSGLIETDGGNGPMRWRGPEEEMRQRQGLKDRRRFNVQPNDRQRYEEEHRLYEMRRTPEETQRRDSPRQHAQPDAGDESETRRRQDEEQRQRAAYELRRRQEEQQRQENPRPNENDRRREDETRRRQQQEEEERRRAYEARRREENPRPNENDRRKQPDNREDETRRRQEEQERQRAYDARRREEEQRQRGRNPPTDDGDTYEKRMQEWRKQKEEHDRLVREREQQRQQHHPQQVDPQRPEAQTKSQEELENERKLQEYIRRNTPIAVPSSGNRDPASDRIRENEQVRRAEHERRLEEERRRKQVQEESRRLAEEERMRRTHESEDAGRNRTRHRGTSPVRPRWPTINTAVTSRTPVESYSSSRRPIPQNRPEENDGRYLESRRNEAAAVGSNSRRPSSEAEEEEVRLKRLKGLPVSATIIVRSTDTGANRTSTPPPALNLRFGEDIDFPGFSPNRRGPEASRFPAPVTRRPPVPSPQPCVWAIVVCCQQHRHQDANQAMKITRCFEATNCPGASWDVDRRCSEPNVRAANEEIREFYLKGQERNY